MEEDKDDIKKIEEDVEEDIEEDIEENMEEDMEEEMEENTENIEVVGGNIVKVKYRKGKNGKSDRKIQLCLNGNCEREARPNGFCRRCFTELNAEKTKDVNVDPNFKINKDGVRMKKHNNFWNQLCMGNNNSCKKYGCNPGYYCNKHYNNTLPTAKEYNEGQIIVEKGIRKIIYKTIKVKLCTANNDTCMERVRKNGLCHTHRIKEPIVNN